MKRHNNITALFRKLKLRTVMTVSFVAIIICAMGITGLLTFLNAQYAVNNLTVQLQGEISDRITNELDHYLGVPQHVNEHCRDSISLGELDIHNNEALKRHFLKISSREDTVTSICFGSEEDGNYTIISKVGKPGIANGTDRFWAISPVVSKNFTYEEYLINQSGTIIQPTLSYPHYDPRTRPWYQDAVNASGPAWTPVIMWLEVGAVSMDATLPVYSDTDTLLGILDTSLTLDGIGEFLQKTPVSKNGQAYIIEKSGLIVASSAIKYPYTTNEGELIRLSALNCSNTPIQVTATYILKESHPDLNTTGKLHFVADIHGDHQYVEVTPYKDAYGLDWLIVVIIPESDVMSEIYQNNLITALLLLLAALGTVYICILLAGWITRPITTLNEEAKAISRGNFPTLQESDREDEIGQLSRVFNQMVDQLRSLFTSLKKSEERYISLFQSSGDAILLFEDAILRNMNSAGEKMFNLTEKEAQGKTVNEIFGKDADAVLTLFQSDRCQSGDGYQDFTLSWGEGAETRYINIRLTHVPSSEDERCLLHLRDITEQRRSFIASAEKEALAESYAQIEMVLKHLPDPMFVIDPQGDILFFNREMEKFSGYTSEQMVGKNSHAEKKRKFSEIKPIFADLILHPEKQTETLYQNLIRKGEILQTSAWVEYQNEKKYLWIIAAPITNKGGQITGVIETIRDITPLKKAEDALVLANKKLSLLSSITRHDIQNKAFIINSQVFLLELTDLNDEQKGYLEVIRRSIKEIERFIAFTRIFQELGQSQPTWQNVQDIFSRVVTAMSLGTISFSISVEHVSILVGPLFEKVCYNLIENATRHGGNLTKIEVSYSVSTEELVIRVSDDGIGIPPDQKEKIFEQGYGKNTGLGLFLSQEVLSLSGITITETGEYGTGSRFELHVPKEKFRIDE